MSHQGKGGLFLRARFGLDNFGEDVLYPQAHRSRVRGLGARLLTSAAKLGAEFGGLSRWAPPAGSRAGRAPVRRHPCQEVCPHRPHGRAMPSRRRAAGEAAAEGCATGPAEGRPPRAAERRGCRRLEAVLRSGLAGGMCSPPARPARRLSVTRWDYE